MGGSREPVYNRNGRVTALLHHCPDTSSTATPVELPHTFQAETGNALALGELSEPYHIPIPALL